ncbi:exodeoxyribonuclease VII large subunit [Novosphingobium fuchskuhlense]|uniref:Exodeoxyribonuclease 7 large subunit n=1 Tax=Novosphingobium fuchskuhlense TaxID=1117702 RepID=A0A117UWQ4_9SPHN|nr:exodeoxyribonuclease VII large subunit [Novosphingobium fuchskuhlense]KUR72246.1 exodeoxyribonuclease VII large subunit [Novosphingobium fuchskuhlense]
MPETPPYRDDADAGLLAVQTAGDNAPALSISEISALLKRTVEDRFGFVRVRGELSGVKRAASGHLYLSLKDENARLDGVMWRGGAQRLGFVPEDGVEVIATGKLTTYPGRSNYQIVIERMEIAGEGALLALLAKTKARLEAEGLFALARKRPLPYLPRVIGVVTSPTGAVIRDILHRLRDRFPTHVVVWPVLVQGQGAAAQIAAAVRGFSAIEPGGMVPRPDLVIVARGGGSIEDLWCFNDEDVVRAIAASSIPTISAVGHETDTTLADFAADVRAPTPTAAAEMAVPVRGELIAGLADLHARQQRAVVRLLGLSRERLEQRAWRLPEPQMLLDAQTQRLDDLADRLRRGLAHRTGLAATQLAQRAAGLRPAVLAARLQQARSALAAQRLRSALVLQRIEAARSAVAGLDRLRRSLDPEAPLARGYVLVKGADGALVRSREAATAQALLQLKFVDGVLDVVPGPAPSPAPARPVARPRPPASGDAQPKLL